jgi:hypothetical protein
LEFLVIGTGLHFLLVFEPIYEGDVDLEALIAETTWAACYDGRLMKWLMTWFKDFRDWILKHNRFLALRAVFGVNIRSEILNALDHGSEIAIQRLSKKTGYAYSGVYREVENLLANGLVEENVGKGRILKLSGKMKDIMKMAA